MSPSPDREFGRAFLTLTTAADVHGLFAGVSSGDQMWMSHGDKVLLLSLTIIIIIIIFFIIIVIVIVIVIVIIIRSQRYPRTS